MEEIIRKAVAYLSLAAFFITSIWVIILCFKYIYIYKKPLDKKILQGYLVIVGFFSGFFSLMMYEKTKIYLAEDFVSGYKVTYVYNSETDEDEQEDYIFPKTVTGEIVDNGISILIMLGGLAYTMLNITP